MTASTDAYPTKIEQVGGKHYRTRGVQHWDVCVAVDLPYLPSAASKYVSRHRAKNGREDLEKAVSYLERHLLAVAKNHYPSNANRGSRLAGSLEFMNWISDARMDGRDTAILHDIMCAGNSQRAIVQIRALIEEEYPVNYIFVPAPGLREEDVFPPPGTPEDGGHHEPRAPESTPSLPRCISQFRYDHRLDPAYRGCYDYNVSTCHWDLKPGFVAHDPVEVDEA